jgi:hypothetical protein
MQQSVEPTSAFPTTGHGATEIELTLHEVETTEPKLEAGTTEPNLELTEELEHTEPASETPNKLTSEGPTELIKHTTEPKATTL